MYSLSTTSEERGHTHAEGACTQSKIKKMTTRTRVVLMKMMMQAERSARTTAKQARLNCPLEWQTIADFVVWPRHPDGR
jgi:propanediol dehydratase large subunit